MMTLKFSRNAKLTLALTGRRPVRSAADDDLEIQSKRQSDACFKARDLDNGTKIFTIMQKKIECDDTTITRSPGTTNVCFSAVTVNDDYRKSDFKIKRRD